MNHTTVKQLIAYLHQFDETLLVAQPMYSEYTILKLEDLGVATLQEPRADGWIAKVWAGKPKLNGRAYLVFPGH